MLPTGPDMLPATSMSTGSVQSPMRVASLLLKSGRINALFWAHNLLRLSTKLQGELRLPVWTQQGIEHSTRRVLLLSLDEYHILLSKRKPQRDMLPAVRPVALDQWGLA